MSNLLIMKILQFDFTQKQNASTCSIWKATPCNTRVTDALTLQEPWSKHC